MRATKLSDAISQLTRVAAVGIASVPCLANASGFALLEQSASRLGTAFAGTAVAADDATTIYFNPAGMTKLNRTEIIGLASGIEITSEFGNLGSSAAFGQSLGGDGGDAGDWNFVPGLYAAVPLGERFVAGIGVNAPFGLKLIYEDEWMGRFQAIKSDVTTLNINPAVAWRVTDRLSIGAGVSYQQVDAELTNAVDYSAVVAQGVQQLVLAGQLPPASAPGVIAANTGLEGHARVKGDDDSWGFNAGVMFDLSDKTHVGLSYRSAIDYTVSGSITFAAPTASNPIGAGIIASASAAGAPLSSGPITVDLKLPDMAYFSVRQGVGDKLELLFDLQWTGWSSVQELRIVRDTGVTVQVTPERWSDVWRYALGATYELTDQFMLRGGVAYDETPVPDETRTPRLPDTNRTWVAVGMRWQPSKELTIDAGYAHLFSETVPLDQNAGNTSSSGHLLGEQTSDIDIISTQLIYRF
jgi:long-chain fatty acid transport protein